MVDASTTGIPPRPPPPPVLLSQVFHSDVMGSPLVCPPCAQRRTAYDSTTDHNRGSVWERRCPSVGHARVARTMETSDPEGGGTALGMHAQAKETEDVEEKATRNETMERGLVVMQLPSTWPDEPSAARVERAVAEAFHHQKGFRNAWLVWPGVGRTNDVMVEDEEGKSPNNNDCTTCVLHFDSERNASRTVRTLLQFDEEGKRKKWTFSVSLQDGTSQELVVGTQQVLVAVRRTASKNLHEREGTPSSMHKPTPSQEEVRTANEDTKGRNEPCNDAGLAQKPVCNTEVCADPATDVHKRKSPDDVPCTSEDWLKEAEENPEKDADDLEQACGQIAPQAGQLKSANEEQITHTMTMRGKKKRKKMVLGVEELQCRKEDPRKWALSHLTDEHRQKLERLKVELTKLLSELHLHGIEDERVLITHLPHVYREKFSRTLKPSDYGFLRLKHVLLEFPDVMEVDENKKVKLVAKQATPTAPTMEEVHMVDNPVRMDSMAQGTEEDANKLANEAGGAFQNLQQSEFDLLREHHEEMGALESALPYLIDECAVLDVPQFQACFVDSLTHDSVEADKNSLGLASPGSFTRVQGMDEFELRQVVEHARMLTEEELHPGAQGGQIRLQNDMSEDRRNFTSSTDDTCKVQEDDFQGEGIGKDPETRRALIAGSFSSKEEWLVREGGLSSKPCSAWKLFQMFKEGELNSNSVLLHKQTRTFVLARDLFSTYQMDFWCDEGHDAGPGSTVESTAWESRMFVEGEPFCEVVASHMSGHCEAIQGFPKVMQLRRQGSLSIADGIAELFRGASRREVLGNVLVLRAKDGTSAPELRKFKSFTQQTADVRRGHTYKYSVHRSTDSVVGFILLLCPLIPELLGPCNSPRQIDLSEEAAWKMGYTNWKLRNLRQPYMLGLQLPFWEGLVINQLGSKDELVGRLSATGPMAVHMLPNRLVIEKCIDEQHLMQPIEAMLSEGSDSFILHGVTPPDVEALHGFIQEEQGASSKVFVCQAKTSMKGRAFIILTPLVRSNGKNILCGCWCRKRGRHYTIA